MKFSPARVEGSRPAAAAVTASFFILFKAEGGRIFARAARAEVLMVFMAPCPSSMPPEMSMIS